VTVVLRWVLVLFGIGDDHSFGGAHDIGPGDSGDTHGPARDPNGKVDLNGLTGIMEETARMPDPRSASR
jgi:hypothetical protein